MKDDRWNKRKTTSMIVVAVVASIGFFVGTYSKYMARLGLPGTNEVEEPLERGDEQADRTSQSGQDLTGQIGGQTNEQLNNQGGSVAKWRVGDVVTTDLLFFPYYTSATGRKSGAVKPSAVDTVFANSKHNVVAPGTSGGKTIMITDDGTEVPYGVTIKDAKVAIGSHDNSATQSLNDKIKFSLKVNGKEDKTNLSAAGLQLALNHYQTHPIPYKGGNTAVVLEIDWKWEFSANQDVTDTNLASQSVVPTITVSFGTAVAEEID
ncbi:MAG: hypothetical protein LBS33_00025 [Streptococcaceae bacterium]|nr:hypothetical protein [Streptococcaceae bacterium]